MNRLLAEKEFNDHLARMLEAAKALWNINVMCGKIKLETTIAASFEQNPVARAIMQDFSVKDAHYQGWLITMEENTRLNQEYMAYMKSPQREVAWMSNAADRREALCESLKTNAIGMVHAAMDITTDPSLLQHCLIFLKNLGMPVEAERPQLPFKLPTIITIQCSKLRFTFTKISL